MAITKRTHYAAAVGAGAAAATSAPYYGTYDYAPGYAGYYDYAPARAAGAAWGPSWWEQPYPPGCGAGRPHC
jgi:hypothetical protein